MNKTIRLTGLLLLSITGCFNYSKWARYHEITQLVEDAGGHVTTAEKTSEFKGKYDDGTIVGISLTRQPISNDQLMMTLPIDTLHGITLLGTEIEDHQLSYVIECENLNSIDLSFTKVTDRGVAQLSQM